MFPALAFLFSDRERSFSWSCFITCMHASETKVSCLNVFAWKGKGRGHTFSESSSVNVKRRRQIKSEGGARNYRLSNGIND